MFSRTADMLNPKDQIIKVTSRERLILLKAVRNLVMQNRIMMNVVKGKSDNSTMIADFQSDCLEAELLLHDLETNQI